MNFSLGLLIRSSLPITGQRLLCELTGARNYCCMLGQTAAAAQLFRVSYLCANHWLSIPAGFLLVKESLSHTVVQYWYFASEYVSDIFVGSLQVLCNRFPQSLELPWRYWLAQRLCANLALQEAGFHSTSGWGHFTSHLIFPCARQVRIDAYRTWNLVWNNLLLFFSQLSYVGYAFYQLCYGLTSLLAFESLCKHLGETC